MNAAPLPVGVLLLAAGGSRRLGQPKQLLPWCGESLLRHAARAALAAQLGPVVVVLGADAARCCVEVADLPVTTLCNEDWASGMASSLRAGVAALLAAPAELAGAVVMLGDQPLVSADMLTRLAAVHRESGRTIVVSQYGDTLGAPAFFAPRHFSALQNLTGDAGARMLFSKYPEELAAVPCPAGAVDVDTAEDWQRLQAQSAPPIVHPNTATMSVQVYGCNHVALEVGDIGEAIAFYQDVFGLEKLDAGEGDAFFKLGQHQFLALFEKKDLQPDRTNRHFGIMVRDEGQLAEVRRKVTEQYGLTLLPEFRCDFRDPWGNRIQVVDLHDESLVWLLPYGEVQKAGVVFGDPPAQP